MRTITRAVGIGSVAVVLTACEVVFPLPTLKSGTGGRNAGGQAASGGAPMAGGGAELTGGAPEGGAGGGGGGTAGEPGSGGVAGGAGGPTAGASGGGGLTGGGLPSTAGYSGTTGTQTGGAATAGTGTGGAGTGGNGCPGTGGPGMVRLPEGYCIDSTEVTRAQYAAWLNTTPPPSTAGQISVCTWNTTFVPYARCGGNDPAGDEYPVCVDWCDAYAYCQGVGKRLCGEIGGGSNEFNDYMDVSLSQWFNACTSHDPANHPYPSGNACGACNLVDDEFGNGPMFPVANPPTCQSNVSGYSGVYDLSGNAAEWEDSCDGATGQADYCWVRGGFYDGDCTDVRCDIDSSRQRAAAAGIRCCS